MAKGKKTTVLNAIGVKAVVDKFIELQLIIKSGDNNPRFAHQLELLAEAVSQRKTLTLDDLRVLNERACEQSLQGGGNVREAYWFEHAEARNEADQDGEILQLDINVILEAVFEGAQKGASGPPR